MYELLISREAEKYYKKQDTNNKRKINKCIEILTKNPLSGIRIKKLHGKLKGKLRYETGGLRIVYKIEARKKSVAIIAIGRRGDVYK